MTGGGSALAPGANRPPVTLRLQGLEKTRCAVFQDHLRIEDFTLRAGRPERLVVPAGEILFRLYDDDTVRAERTIRVEIGDRKDLGFDLQ